MSWNPDDKIDFGAKRAQCRQCGAPTTSKTATMKGPFGEMMTVTMRSAYCSEECERIYDARLAAHAARTATLGVFMGAGVSERMQREYEDVRDDVIVPPELRDLIDPEHRRRAVHIHGRPCTGKTTLALYALDRMAQGKQIANAVYTLEADMLRDLKPFGERLEHYISADLLIIDRCGIVAASVKDIELIDTLIYHREARGAYTITISRMTLKQLMQDTERGLYSESVIQRLVKLAGSVRQLETANNNFVLAGLK